MKDTTLVNHPPEVAVPADNRPLVAPIYQSVKFSFDDTNETLRYLRGERDGFFYSRTSNPTLRQLQRLLSRSAGPGRLPAHRLGSCDHRREPAVAVQERRSRSCCSSNPMAPTRYIVQHLLAKFGVTHTCCRSRTCAGIERVLAAQPTRLVIFESPTNPVTKIADIEHLTAPRARAPAA